MRYKFSILSILFLLLNSCNSVKDLNGLNLHRNGHNLKNTVKEITSFKNDTIVISTIEFEKNGFQNFFTITNPEMNVNYIYKNKLLKEINTSTNYLGKIHRSKQLIIYDSNKRIIERIFVSDEKQNDYTMKYKYSGKEKTVGIYPRNKPSYSLYYFYENEFLYEKDASNNLISTSKMLGETYKKVKEYTRNNKIKTEYVYNEQHDLILLNFYQNNTISNYIKHEYVYDQYNNWTIQKTTDNKGYTYSTKREIEYY